VTDRRLAAILSADAVGYSRLMSEDEDATVAALGVARRSVQQLVPEHHGRLVDFNGDNFLAEFPSALDGARCAVASQEGFVVPDRTSSGRRARGGRAHLRGRRQHRGSARGIGGAGWHLPFGRRARAGGPKLELAFEDLGERSIENIPDPVRVFRLRIVPDRPLADLPTSKTEPACFRIDGRAILGAIKVTGR
jgi:adenylate cyclase